MGNAYSARQSTMADGNVITAALFNNEFDQLVLAFNTSGHAHDGTAGEGGNITALRGHALTFGLGTAGTDVVVTFDGETNDGVLSWMEDEDYFQFSDDVLLTTTEKLQFGDTASFIQQSSDGVLRIDGEATIDLNASTAVTVSNDLKLDSDSAVLGFGADNDTTLTHTDGSGLTLNSSNKLMFRDSAISINSSTDGQLDIVADTEVQIAATTVDINGNVDISGTLTVGSGIDFNEQAITNVGSIALDSITGDNDADTSITFSGSDVITIATNNATRTVINNTGIDVTGEVKGDTLNIDGASSLAGAVTDVTTLTASGEIEGGSLDINGAASIAGAVTDVTTLTASGEIEGGSLDINGAADISGDLTLSAGGDGALTFANAGENSIKIPDNQASALIIEEANTAYMTFVTTNSGEKVTFGKDIEVTGTITSDGLSIGDASDQNGAGEAISIGVGGDLKLFHKSDVSYIHESGASALNIQAANLNISTGTASDDSDPDDYYRITTTAGTGYVRLYHGEATAFDSHKFQTKATGIEVIGSIILTDSSGNSTTLQEGASGDITLTLPSSAGTLALTSDITVTASSTTTFTNKSISGEQINSGTVAAARVATLNQDTTGNAATATVAKGAAVIHSQSTDGTTIDHADVAGYVGKTVIYTNTGDSSSLTLGVPQCTEDVAVGEQIHLVNASTGSGASAKIIFDLNESGDAQNINICTGATVVDVGTTDPHIVAGGVATLVAVAADEWVLFGSGVVDNS